MSDMHKENLFEVKGLTKRFQVRTGAAQQKQFLHAVSDISFNIRKGEVFGLVGESGCGKSTTGRLLLQLIKPTAGEVLFDGQDLTKLSNRQLKAYRARMQMVFQDPYASFDPRQSILDSVGEPLEIYGRVKNKAEKIEKVGEDLKYSWDGERLQLDARPGTPTTVYNVTGTVVLRETFSGDALNLHSLDKGVYIVNVGGQTFKIVKK